MNLKTAALLALIGSFLLAITALLTLFRNVSLLANGGVAMSSALDALIYAFFAVSLTIFFFVFHKNQR